MLSPSAVCSGHTNARKLFKRNFFKQFFDEHLWVSVCVRKSPGSFTRAQRLSCCLAILFLTMVSNAMWYKTEEKRENVEALSIGPLTFTVHELYTSVMTSLTVVPAVLLITLFFAKSAAKELKENANENSNNSNCNHTAKTRTAYQHFKDHGELPHWTVYIGWVTVFLTVFVAGFFTILYSFQWGHVISTAWLSAFLLSFVESVILIQPLKVGYLS